METTLSWLLDSRSESPLFVLFGDFVLLLIVFFLIAVTWCSRVVVELRKKFATRCGIFSGGWWWEATPDECPPAVLARV